MFAAAPLVAEKSVTAPRTSPRSLTRTELVAVADVRLRLYVVFPVEGSTLTVAPLWSERVTVTLYTPGLAYVCDPLTLYTARDDRAMVPAVVAEPSPQSTVAW